MWAKDWIHNLAIIETADLGKVVERIRLPFNNGTKGGGRESILSGPPQILKQLDNELIIETLYLNRGWFSRKHSLSNTQMHTKAYTFQ